MNLSLFYHQNGGIYHSEKKRQVHCIPARRWRESTDSRLIIRNYRPIIVRFFCRNRPIWAACKCFIIVSFLRANRFMEKLLTLYKSSRNRQVKHGESSIRISREKVFCSPNLNRSSPNLDSSSLNLGVSSPNLNSDRSNPANRNHKMFFAKKLIESISLAVSRRGQGRSTCYVLVQPVLGGSHV